VRTEDDLRTALTALERHAPAAARVLPGSGHHSSHGLRSPRTVRWLAATAATAALAGAVTALTLGAPTRSVQNGGVASSGSASAATVRAKVLAAFSAASGDVVYASGTTLTAGRSATVTQSWSYPSQPSPGQLVRGRSVTFNRSGTEHSDSEMTFVQPSPETSRSTGAWVTGEWLNVDYLSKTWLDQKILILATTDLSKSAVISEHIGSGPWTVRRTTLNGRAALEFSFKVPGNPNSPTSHLWVDAATYLPLRETDFYGPSGMVSTGTLDFEYLPATPANLAKLTPPIPAGFKRVSNNNVGGGEIVILPQPVQSVPSLRPSPR
jgi:hypothetical protein